MTARSILQSFDAYRLARMSFVQTVAELATRHQNVDILLGANVLGLLKPLVEDVCVQVQQCAVVALGRIAHHAGPSIGLKAVNDGILHTILHHLDRRNKHFKRAAMFVLRSICRHGTDTNDIIVSPESGTLQALMLCLCDLDSQVKEAAAWAAGYIARSNQNLARAVVDAGAIPHLVLCLQEPEISIRRVAASALADIARYSGDLSITIMNANGVAHLARALSDRDDGLKRQALLALACIAKHGVDAAEAAIQAEVFPNVLVLMGHKCPLVRRNAALLVRDIVRHTPDLAQYVVNMGGIGALVELVNSNFIPVIRKDKEKRDKDMEVDDFRVPAVASLGFMCGFGSHFCYCVVNSGGVSALYDALNKSSIRSELKSVSAWCLGQLAHHCPKQVSESNALTVLLEAYLHSNGSEELRSRCFIAMKVCIQGCTSLSVLEPLLSTAPVDVLKIILTQLTKILPMDPRARRLFVSCGGLKKIQEIDAEPGSTTMECITLINNCFPEEIVRFYTPGYPDILLDKVENYKPNGGEDATDGSKGLMDQDGPMPSRTVSKELEIIFDD